MTTYRRRHAAVTFALIAGLGILPAVGVATSANAATTEPSPTASAPVAVEKIQPTLTVDLLEPAVAPNPAEIRVRMTPQPAVRPPLEDVIVRTDGGDFSTGYWESPNDFWVATADLPAGHHWAQAYTPETATLAAAISPRFEFDIAPEPVRVETKTTLTLPSNPVGGVPSPYTVTVTPSAGSTGVVNLFTYDPFNQLAFLGTGNLSHGKATITATVAPGRHVIVAQFVGDDRYARSEAGAAFDYPVNPPLVEDPPLPPAPTENPTASPTGTPVVDQSGAHGEPRSGELAYTGVDPWPGVTAALILLGAGVTLLIVRRRRRA